MCVKLHKIWENCAVSKSWANLWKVAQKVYGKSWKLSQSYGKLCIILVSCVKFLKVTQHICTPLCNFVNIPKCHGAYFYLEMGTFTLLSEKELAKQWIQVLHLLYKSLRVKTTHCWYISVLIFTATPVSSV